MSADTVDIDGDVPDDEAVLYEVTDAGVAVITLNRPERLNTWGRTSRRASTPASTVPKPIPHVRVIVVTGRGRAFCAGASLGTMADIGESLGNAAGTDVSTLVGERHPHFVTELTKPVIAAINGSCVGYGLTQALMCDIRFAAAGAKFATSFARRGLIAEYGISWILPRLVGWSAALELLLSGRTFLAEEAAELGLVSKVWPADELMDRVLAYAEDIARNCSPASLAVIKRAGVR